jgi:hypothetical protein
LRKFHHGLCHHYSGKTYPQGVFLEICGTVQFYFESGFTLFKAYLPLGMHSAIFFSRISDISAMLVKPPQKPDFLTL